MRIILLCIFIALVARSRGKSSFSYLPASGFEGGSRNSRSGPGGGSNGVSGFYIPAKRGASSGGGSSYRGSGTDGKQGSGGSGNTFNLPGPIGEGSTISGPAANYGPPTSSDSGRLKNKGGRGGAVGGNFQRWTPNVEADLSSLPGPIGGLASGGNNLHAAGSYGVQSASVLSNKGNARGTPGDNNFQSSNSDAVVPSFPGPIGGANGIILPIGNSGAETYGAPSGSALSNQGDNRGAAGSNSFQVWNSNQSGKRLLFDSYGKPIVNAGSADGSFQANNAAHFTSYGSNEGVDGGSVQAINAVIESGHNHVSTFQGNNANLGSISHGGGGFQGYNANAGNVVEQGPIGGFSSGSFQGYDAIAGNIGNQGGNGGFGGGNSHGYDGKAGNIGNQGGIGAVVSSLQGHSIGSISHGDKGDRSAGGRSFLGRNFGGYSKVSVDHQTSEGLHVDPRLLDRIRTILYLDESRASSTSHGALSSAYGVPRRGRVTGVQLEGISQSIHIAQFSQTSPGLTGGNFPSHTLAIIRPSSSYGAS